MKSLLIWGIALFGFILAAIGLSTASYEPGASGPVDVMLFMFFGIGLGVLIMQVLNKIGDPLPYTCVVFLVGILLAVITTDNANGGVFAKSLNQWINIDAELLLFVFLPPLIFGEAMSLNWYQTVGALPQALVLAGPGVLIGAALMGCLARAVLPYNWNWNLCMIFGSILAATDPVAVVALLKSLGASPKLTMIVVGESILNDGTAMVLFTVFNNAFNGKVYTPGSILSFFLAATLGSVTLGCTVGFVAVRWMRTHNRALSDSDSLAQIAITICTAYLTFYIAQKTLEISGVLACCSAGFIMSWLGPPIILNHENLEAVWHAIEWSLNTFIFFLAGMIIGHRTFLYVSAQDWFIMIFFYVFLQIFRFFVIGVLFPLISNLGNKCTKAEGIFIAWGGLRGALGMALALIAYREGPEDMQEETSRLLFYVGGIAALTLIINAPTSSWVLYRLKLTGGEDSPEKKLVMACIGKKMRKCAREGLRELIHEFSLSEKQIEEVCGSVTILNTVTVLDFVDEIAEHEGKDLKVSKGRNRASSLKMSGHNLDLLDKAGATAAALDISPPTPTSTTNSDDDDEFKLNNVDDPEAGWNGRPQRSRASSGVEMMLNPIQIMRKMSVTSMVSIEEPRDHMTADELKDQLNEHALAGETTVTPALLGFVRSLFLATVRVSYWHDIEEGKLPREGKPGRLLLYSVEVGLDDLYAGVTTKVGTRDWALLTAHVDTKPLSVRGLTYLEETAPKWLLPNTRAHMLNRLECRAEENYVYILTSFIAAHEHAQKQIHGFLAAPSSDNAPTPRDGMGQLIQSAEEKLVINESKAAVEDARRRLEAMNHGTIAAIKTKQAAYLVLIQQADMVKSMVSQGLLSPNDAEGIIEQITKDMAGVKAKRKKMYRDHLESSILRRKAHREMSTPIRTSSSSSSISDSPTRSFVPKFASPKFGALRTDASLLRSNGSSSEA
ncbi:Sodium/hydrogen exchanger family-domain-containing protein [Ochromonadaceae sp. CCMP2298]|nr:Sodium/hydrogen exchanger family-domain-containing protein [Ochromonadaceae sp. CCMP2298]